jgi:hypothetical protein
VKASVGDNVDEHAEDQHRDGDDGRAEEGDPASNRDLTPKCRLDVEPSNNSIDGSTKWGQA